MAYKLENYGFHNVTGNRNARNEIVCSAPGGVASRNWRSMNERMTVPKGAHLIEHSVLPEQSGDPRFRRLWTISARRHARICLLNDGMENGKSVRHARCRFRRTAGDRRNQPGKVPDHPHTPRCLLDDCADISGDVLRDCQSAQQRPSDGPALPENFITPSCAQKNRREAASGWPK